MSSPVKLLGALNTDIRTSSIVSFFSSTILPYVIVLGLKVSRFFPLKTELTISIALLPDTLIIATAPLPGGVDIAAIVSFIPSIHFYTFTCIREWVILVY